MAGATTNRFNFDKRQPLWLVTYELDPAFFNLASDAQYRTETGDAVYAVELAMQFEWKAAYTTTDFKKGWIVLKLGTQAEVEKIMTGYSMYKYFTNITYTQVYSATQAGIDLSIIWAGFKKYLRDRFSSRT